MPHLRHVFSLTYENRINLLETENLHILKITSKETPTVASSIALMWLRSMSKFNKLHLCQVLCLSDESYV